MSIVDFVFEEKAADIGNFLVGRLLPFRQKRNIGPFVFIDHMGPVNMDERSDLDVAPHPHIGLSTLTYLFDGAIQHKDSIGNNIEIQPGAVNWMTAGKGVTHSERTPERLRGEKKSLHGLQIWVALPKDKEQIEPSFHHVAAEDIPEWKEAGVTFRLVAGEFQEKKSPVPVYSKLYMIEMIVEKPQKFNFANQLYGESGLYILEGEIKHADTTFEEKHILITKDAHLCEFEVTKPSKIYIFGGMPFDEPRYIMWNFVSSSKETLEQAKDDWINKRFPEVPGDGGYVPFPERK